MIVNGIEYDYDRFGILKQNNPQPITYDERYLALQKTTDTMSALRLGFLMSAIDYPVLAKMDCVDVGVGTGAFIKFCRNAGLTFNGYDVAKSEFNNTTIDELHSKHYDLVTCFDCLEHFQNIEDFFKIDFDWAYVSVPALPDDMALFENWRHRRPSEHLFHFREDSFSSWANSHGYGVERVGCPEDLIRKRWDAKYANILSFIIH